jgi:hypothetical protein
MRFLWQIPRANGSSSKSRRLLRACRTLWTSISSVQEGVAPLSLGCTGLPTTSSTTDALVKGQAQLPLLDQ